MVLFAAPRDDGGSLMCDVSVHSLSLSCLCPLVLSCPPSPLFVSLFISFICSSVNLHQAETQESGSSGNSELFRLASRSCSPKLKLLALNFLKLLLNGAGLMSVHECMSLHGWVGVATGGASVGASTCCRASYEHI